MRPRPQVVVCAVAALSACATPSLTAWAAPPEPPTKKLETTFDSSSLLDRPHTIASLELGAVVLPTAPISRANQGGSTPLGGIGNGDATLETSFHLLYRANRDYAIGAGAMFAPKPTSDSGYSSATGGLTRTHSRSYMVLGVEGRYFPLRYRWFEGWVGANVGVVVIADRFATQGEDVPTILGTREYTVRTEGIGVGVAVGGDYIITDNWVVGLAIRADRWILPNATNQPLTDPACSSIGDCPTLTGTVAAFQIGIAVGYRIPL